MNHISVAVDGMHRYQHYDRFCGPSSAFFGKSGWYRGKCRPYGLSMGNFYYKRGKMAELWDLFDRDRKPLGRVIERGKKLSNDEYHIVVYVWMYNSRGEYLLSRRSPEKYFPLKWEPTGGSVVAGEDSLCAALREVKEELGITLSPSDGELFDTQRYDNPRWENPGFVDTWIFRCDCDICSIILQDGETCDAMWASEEKIYALRESGDFVHDLSDLSMIFRKVKTLLNK